MKISEFHNCTEFSFTGEIYLDSTLVAHWDNPELDRFLETLAEHNITDFAISQTHNEVMQREITVRVSVDAFTPEFEYDLTTLMLQGFER